ncbi:hypothetical protein FBZ88_11390 [Nitrospirillum bahiense]|uniref:Uncharacterized protein n=1 Tax=Nitrospirillum amazonense TaxID=28077 RepID=A0A560FQN5_9PROT|nr:hypothetical protein FBZ88_11390 [Nitrospirillum amazonense]
MFLGNIKAAIAVAVLLSVCACTSSSTVESNKSADYNGSIKKLFLFTNLGKTLYSQSVVESTQETDPAAFVALMRSSLESCGIAMDSFARPADGPAHNILPQHIPLQGADAILEISWTRERTGGQGHITDYLASLLDVQSKTVVWKATIELKQHFKAPEELTNALINRMKRDGLIGANCVPPKSDW